MGWPAVRRPVVSDQLVRQACRRNGDAGHLECSRAYGRLEVLGRRAFGAAGAGSGRPWGWVIMGAVAGLALLPSSWRLLRTAAQQFADGLQNSINASDMTDGFTKIGTGLSQLQTKMQQTGVAADHTSSQITASDGSFKGLGWLGRHGSCCVQYVRECV